MFINYERMKFSKNEMHKEIGYRLMFLGNGPTTPPLSKHEHFPLA